MVAVQAGPPFDAARLGKIARRNYSGLERQPAFNMLLPPPSNSGAAESRIQGAVLLNVCGAGPEFGHIMDDVPGESFSVGI